MSARSARERRESPRTVVVWDALAGLLPAVDPETPARRAPLDVLDIGGGTGLSAVRVAELGHRVTVVDPSPDALAALGRRADEAGVRVAGHQGDVSDLVDLLGADSADVVLCHGVLEVVDDPAAALAAIARSIRPAGVLSLLVAQHHAAVLARAVAGHFGQALELVAAADEPVRAEPVVGRTGRRFTHEQAAALLAEAGFTLESTHGVRVFADLVPGSLLDLEAGAASGLVELERAVAARSEYLPLATQLHLVARRG